MSKTASWQLVDPSQVIRDILAKSISHWLIEDRLDAIRCAEKAYRTAYRTNRAQRRQGVTRAKKSK